MEDFILKGPIDNSGIPKGRFGDILLQFIRQRNPEDIVFVSSFLFIIMITNLVVLLNRLNSVLEKL